MVMHVCLHHRIIFTKSSHRFFGQYLPSQNLNSNTRVKCERCSSLTKKTLAKRESIVVVHLLHWNKL